MFRRVLNVAAGGFVVGGLIFGAALVYVVVRPDDAGVKAARELARSVETPESMRFVGEGTDHKTPYRDFLVADIDVDELAEVRPPTGYRLHDRFRNGGGPFAVGASLIVAEWSGPDPRRGDHDDCMIFLERTKDAPRDSALSESERATIEASDRTLVRVSAACDVD